MLDIKWIRENPDEFDAAMKKRGNDMRAERVAKSDKNMRSHKTKLQELQQESNSFAKKIGELMSQGKKEEANELVEKSKQVKQQIATMKMFDSEKDVEGYVEEILSELPNILLDDVPEGEDESANQEIRKWGEPSKFDFKAKDHIDIGEALGLIDFEQTAKISGARFATIKGGLARLERALASFMLDIHVNEFGFTEISPPLMTRQDALYGTGQLPKFEEDLFKTQNVTYRWRDVALELAHQRQMKPEKERGEENYESDRQKVADSINENTYYMIPTSEVVLANMVRESILTKDELPIRYTAYTPCFRSEAGSAGKDTRGMIRLHQFSKVELVSITTPEQEAEEHERITEAAEQVLKKLELPYRTMLLCSGDTGFSSRKTYDIEVWLPGQDTYREISSVSMCGDFQARRMKARYKAGEKDNRFVHTLNGSGLAVGRTIVAILENYQNEDGSVSVPAALQQYMGCEKIVSST